VTEEQTTMPGIDKPMPQPTPTRRPSPHSRPEPKPVETESAETESTVPEPAGDAGAATRTRWYRKAKVRLAIALLALAIGVGAVDMVLSLQVDRAAATDQARTAAAQVAQNSMPVVLSYNYTAMAGYPAAAEGRTTGEFRKALANLINTAVLPAATSQQIVTKTTAVATSVVQADPDTVVLLMFINQQTSSKTLTTPQIEGSRIRVTTQRVGGTWLISQFEPV
jgi:Mce-associated membrane protein